MKKRVDIMEVCPRDGWQNLKSVIPYDRKIHYVKGMLDAGVQHMQICSFVNPKAIPQMADAPKLAAEVAAGFPGCEFNALIPNLRGAQTAVNSGIGKVSFVISASEAHNKRNVNKTVEESLAALEEIRTTYPDLKVILAVATTFGCPFEGDIPLEKPLAIIQRGVELGIDHVELADTIGIADPEQVKRVFSTVREKYPQLTLLSHMHDTRNNGIINSWTAAENGADIIHTALGGLGGCPFAPGASGNTSSEDFLYLLEKSGIETGIDVPAYIKLAKEMREEIQGTYSGHQINIASNSCTG